MDNSPFIQYAVEDKSFISFIKREIHHAAVSAPFSPQRVGKIDLIVSELTSNIVKHAGQGELLYRFTRENGCHAFEVICLDNGPGIKDISHSMKDGVTTTKTLGQGLGALKRLSDTFFVYSMEKWGTVCYSKSYSENYTPPVDPSGITFSALNVSKPGQSVSGDGFDVVYNLNHTKFMLGDGLGHGAPAFSAVQLALANFKICPETDPVKIIEFIHDPAKKTRGLVATAVTADHRLKKWNICGIGNIATRLYEGIETKNYVSYNGIVGMNIPRTLKNHVTDLNKHQCLILTSDGVNTRWDQSKFPGIMRHDPLMLAIAIYKDCARRTDDMSILIART